MNCVCLFFFFMKIRINCYRYQFCNLVIRGKAACLSTFFIHIVPLTRNICRHWYRRFINIPNISMILVSGVQIFLYFWTGAGGGEIGGPLFSWQDQSSDHVKTTETASPVQAIFTWKKKTLISSPSPARTKLREQMQLWINTLWIHNWCKSKKS